MPAEASIILSLHTLTTMALTGLIWFVQVVHYPMFQLIGTHHFTQYERVHQQRTTWVVAPLMLVELITAVWLIVRHAAITSAPLAVWGLALLAIIWCSTAFLQVPCHRKLEQGSDQAIIRRLVLTNWIRTIAWTMRSIIAIAMLSEGSNP